MKTIKISSREIVLLVMALLCFVIGVFSQVTLLDKNRKIIKLNTTYLEAEQIIKKRKDKPKDQVYYLQTNINGVIRECKLVPKNNL